MVERTTFPISDGTFFVQGIHKKMLKSRVLCGRVPEDRQFPGGIRTHDGIMPIRGDSLYHLSYQGSLMVVLRGAIFIERSVTRRNHQPLEKGVLVGFEPTME